MRQRAADALEGSGVACGGAGAGADGVDVAGVTIDVSPPVRSRVLFGIDRGRGANHLCTGSHRDGYIAIADTTSDVVLYTHIAAGVRTSGAAR